MNNQSQKTEEQALNTLAAACAKREYATGDLDDKMRRWGLTAEERRRVLDQLSVRGFYDDERFCRAYVSDKVRYDKWGRRKIEQGLWLKQVAEEVSRPILDAVPDEDYLEVLRPMLRSKWRSVKGKNDYERSMKLIKYAMGRGYELRLIRQCIDEAEDVDEVWDEG